MGARFLIAARWFGGYPRASVSAPKHPRAFVDVINWTTVPLAVPFDRIEIREDEHGLMFVGHLPPLPARLLGLQRESEVWAAKAWEKIRLP